VALSTNAMLLTGEAADTLLESRLDFLMIPFDGATPETVERIRKGSNFQILKKNVEDFLRKIKNKNPSFNVILQLIQMPQNRGDIDRFVQTWKDFPEAKVIVKDLHDFANQVENIQTLKHGKEKIPERTEGACYEPWRGMIVGWDGQVVPCCNDYDYKYVLGDLNRETLLQVWNGSRMKSLRRLQSKGKAKEILLCQRCFFPSLSPVQAYSLFSPFSSSLFELNCYANQGLYPADFGFDPPLHWTEKNFEILVQDRCGRVIFHFENRNPWASSLEMGIYCYDRWVTTAVFKKGERKAIQLSTPSDFQGRLLRFRFRLSHAWIPDSQTEGRDKGEVGILLQGIENG
jgi:radical SAM protein with 4Fe4S-binding SPASM domain